MKEWTDVVDVTQLNSNCSGCGRKIRKYAFEFDGKEYLCSSCAKKEIGAEAVNEYMKVVSELRNAERREAEKEEKKLFRRRGRKY